MLPRYDVIYHLIGDLKIELGDRMPSVQVEDVVGRLLVQLLFKQPLLILRATVIQQFQITEKKEKVAVAGCRVRVGSHQYVSNLENLQVGMGRLPRDGTYRVSRAGVTLFEGRLASLKHQKV